MKDDVTLHYFVNKKNMKSHLKTIYFCNFLKVNLGITI